MKKKIYKKSNMKPVENKDFLNSSEVLTDLCNISLGKAIREIRLEQKLSQCKLANLTQLDQAHICNLENGNHSPRSTTVHLLCRGLDYKTEDLMKKSSIYYDSLVENAADFIFEDEHGNYHVEK